MIALSGADANGCSGRTTLWWVIMKV